MWKRFCREDGASSVEYALFIGAVAGVMVFAVGALGVSTKQSLSQLTADIVVIEPVQMDLLPESGQPSPRPSKRQAWLLGPATLLAAGACMVFNTLILAAIVRRSNRKTIRDDAGPTLDPVIKQEQDIIFRKRQDVLKVLSRHLQGMFENRLQVRHLMSTNIVTVLPTDRVEQVVEVMTEHRFRHLLVCDEQSNLKGIISSRDVRWCPDKRAADVMSAEPVTTEPDTLISTATTIFLQRRISALPVVAEGKLLGILTTTDLLMSLQCLLQLTQRATAEKNLSLQQDVSSSHRISEISQA